MVKTLTIISIKPNGNIKLKDVQMIKDMVGLKIPIKGNGRGSIGPEFIKNPYTFVLEYAESNDHKEINIHSNMFLNAECGCGYKCQHDNFRGSFYLVKHNPNIGRNHNFDFSKEITYEEFEQYDSAVNCTEEDINFVKREIRKRYQPFSEFCVEYILNKLIAFGPW